MKHRLFKKSGLILLKLALIYKTLSFISCNDYNEDKAIYTIDLEKLEAKELIIDSLFVVDKIVQLETTGESVINYINKLFLSNKYIVVVDIFGSSVLVFDSSGAFITKIAKQGRGPGEYIKISDIYVEFEHGLIYILDGYDSKKILKYSLTGDFLGETRINFGADSFTKMDKFGFAFFQPTGNSIINSNKHFEVILTDSAYQQRWTGIPFNEKWAGYSYQSSMVNTVFSNNNHDVFFTPSIPHGINKVYKISPSLAEPYLEISPDNNRKLSKLLETLTPSNGGVFDHINKSGFYYNLNSFSEAGNSISFSIAKGGNNYFVFHEKNSYEYRILNQLTSDSHHGFFYPSPINNGTLINIVEVTSILDNDFSLFNSIKTNLKVDTNPILVTYKVKKTFHPDNQ